MKAVLHYAAGARLQEMLAGAGLPFYLAIVPETDDALLAREMADAEVLLHVLRPFRAADIDAAPRLRLIQKIGVGTDTIDIEAAKRRGIAVCNMPGTNTAAVAEMTLALMLAALRRLAALDRATREGHGWRPPEGLLDGLGEIGGRAVGLVGYGAVPRRLRPVLEALGARVIVSTRTPPDDGTPSLPLDDLLAAADIVSLHVPGAPETAGLIGRGRLALMRPAAVLVNTARGALVDQDALAEALASGRLAAAGLDVFAHESADPAHPLFALPNVVVTPHVAWITGETWRRSLEVIVENVTRLAAGRPLLHRVA